MKKILALLLIICSCFAIVSCKRGDDPGSTDGAGDDNLERFSAMFAASVPKKSETTATVLVNDIELVSTYILKTGTIGGKAASVMETSVTNLSDVENDQGKLNETTTKKTTYYYLEGKGIRTNKGKWDETGEDFAPKAGSIALDLKKEYFSKIEYFNEGSSEKLVLHIAEDFDGTNEYAKKVLAKFIPASQPFGYETVITITATGGRISGILIECIEYEHTLGDDMFDAIQISDAELTVDVKYSYGIELDLDFE